MKRRQFLKAMGAGLLAPSALLATPHKGIKKSLPAEKKLTADAKPQFPIAGIALEDIPKDGWGRIQIRGPSTFFCGQQWEKCFLEKEKK